MKKLILLAVSALFFLSSCEKEVVTVVGNGIVTCSPSSITMKVGEVKSFTFVCHDSSITELAWKSSDTATRFSYSGGNTIEVLGKKVGEDIIMCYNPKEESASYTILGGLKVVVK